MPAEPFIASGPALGYANQANHELLMSPASRKLSAIALLLGAISILPVMDAAGKHLSLTLPVLMSVWARFSFQSLLITPLVLHQYGWRVFLHANAPMQITRSLCLVASSACFFSGMRYLPLADTLAIFFISPILVTALSPLVLGEKARASRWLAVIGGFVGVLVIIRPGFSEVNLGTLFGLSSGFLYACFVLLTRRLRGLPVMVTTMWNTLPGAIALAIAAPFYWKAPELGQWPLLLLIGVISVTAHFMLMHAFERAEASLLAPFAYAEIISGTIVGYLWFGDLPDHYTFLGAGILIASGIYISWSETRRDPAEILESQ